MEQQFINELMEKLSYQLSVEDLELVKRELTVVINNYNVQKISTEIVAYQGLPECYKYYIATKKIEGTKESTLKLYDLRLRQFFGYVKKRSKRCYC